MSSLSDDVDLASDDQGSEIQSAPRVLPPFWVQKVSDVLHTLQDFAPIEALIREWYELSQASVIPAPFILNSLAPVQSMTKDLISGRKTDDMRSSITVKVIQNTAEIFETPPSAAGKDFHLLYTGEAIRLEIIGVICSIAGRAAYLGLAGVNFDNEKQRLQFSRKMLIASDAALYICKILTPLNDLTIWLVHEMVLFSNIANGTSSEYKYSSYGLLLIIARSSHMESTRRAIYGHLRAWPASGNENSKPNA